MILETIANAARKRVAEREKILSAKEVERLAREKNPDTGFPFEKALAKPGISFICEVKKASPSKGIIAPEFPYLEIAKEYEQAGAAAISCLTEPEFFLGSDQYLLEIASLVSIPVLRKDFTIDPYMIYEAKVLNASAVLLICSLLNDAQLKEYLEIAHSLGLSALVEAHTEEEVDRAVAVGARIIGVNNRNLKDFTVDIQNSERLRSRVPGEILYVSESGIRTPEDIGRLYRNGTDAVLIGETLMRSEDKKAELNKLSSLCKMDPERKKQR
ncbi:MAG: indole-3-glycerol phosphate synthase TrpC [Fusicatenibacter sp.]|nr:indole-3-glycerol phosphate synthase TrpC [Fusicatenibacter sp.]